MKYCFGVDVGGTTVKMGLFQVDGVLLEKWEIPTRKESVEDLILPDIAKAIEERINSFKIAKEDIAGVGLGVPASVKDDGYVKKVSNLGWKEKHVQNDLEALIKLPVKVANDANVAALGELWKGGGKGYSNLVMLTLGTGVGGAIILNGQILAGSNGGAGEIGHMLAKRDETKTCGCGKKGCLEQYASATGISRLAIEMLVEYTGNTVLSEEKCTAKDVFDAVKMGDELAIQVATEFGKYLGYAMADLGAVIDPDVFVIGGGVSKAGEILFDYIEGPYKERAFFTCENTKFALAKLGNDAGIYGAAKLVI